MSEGPDLRAPPTAPHSHSFHIDSIVGRPADITVRDDADVTLVCADCGQPTWRITKPETPKP